jgi:hypothetical protein
MVALTVVRDRDNEVHSGTDSCWQPKWLLEQSIETQVSTQVWD